MKKPFQSPTEINTKHSEILVIFQSIYFPEFSKDLFLFAIICQ